MLALPDAVMITESPPRSKLFPCASIACIVIVDNETPSAVTVFEDAVNVDVVATAAPGVNEMFSIAFMVVVLSVALTTTVSERLLVNVAV